jgi:hypothetical protein
VGAVPELQGDATGRRGGSSAGGTQEVKKNIFGATNF